jgi:hypothetical protein
LITQSTYFWPRETANGAHALVATGGGDVGDCGAVGAGGDGGGGAGARRTTNFVTAEHVTAPIGLHDWRSVKFVGTLRLLTNPGMTPHPPQVPSRGLAETVWPAAFKIRTRVVPVHKAPVNALEHVPADSVENGGSVMRQSTCFCPSESAKLSHVLNTAPTGKGGGCGGGAGGGGGRGGGGLGGGFGGGLGGGLGGAAP